MGKLWAYFELILIDNAMVHAVKIESCGEVSILLHR